MRFLANENFPYPSIDILNKAGYSVISIAELYHGISDAEVLNKAKEAGLIILTFDKDYGEIIFRHKEETPPGVIFFRFKGESPEHAGQILLSLLTGSDLKFENSFTVIEQDGIRQRIY